MSLKLPLAPGAYDKGDQAQMRGAVERADLQNRKRQEDLVLGPGQRLVFYDEHGAQQQYTGAILGGLVRSDMAAQGLSPAEQANARANIAAGSGTGTPGGAGGQVQFNSGGAFGGFTVGGDASLNVLTGALTLAAVNADTGVFGDATHVSQLAVNAKGLVTAAASVPIATFTGSTAGFAPASGGGTTNFLRADGTWAPAGIGTVTTTGTPASGALTRFSGATSVTNGDLSGDVTTSGTLTTTLTTSGVTAGSYTSADITVDAKGRVTAAANGAGGGAGLTQLAQVVTTAGNTSITLATGISAGYRRLVVTGYVGSTSSSGTNTDFVGLQFNGDTTSGHYWWSGAGAYNGGAFQPGSGGIGTSMFAGMATSMGLGAGFFFGQFEVDIPNYAQTSWPIGAFFKSTARQGNVGQLSLAGGGQWEPTSLQAITSIVIVATSGTALTAGSTFTLWGQR